MFKRIHILTPAALALLLVAGCESTTIKGPQGQELSISTSESINIERGETRPLVVEIDRENFSGAVTVSVGNLPEGVVVDASSRTVETDAATFMLTAGDSAPLVSNHAVEIRVSGPDGMSGMHHVQLDVEQ